MNYADVDLLPGNIIHAHIRTLSLSLSFSLTFSLSVVPECICCRPRFLFVLGNHPVKRASLLDARLSENSQISRYAWEMHDRCANFGARSRKAACMKRKFWNAFGAI